MARTHNSKNSDSENLLPVTSAGSQYDPQSSVAWGRRAKVFAKRSDRPNERIALTDPVVTTNKSPFGEDYEFLTATIFNFAGDCEIVLTYWPGPIKRNNSSPRCQVMVTSGLDSTGENSAPCNSSTDHFCEECGDVCSSCAKCCRGNSHAVASLEVAHA